MYKRLWVPIPAGEWLDIFHREQMDSNPEWQVNPLFYQRLSKLIYFSTDPYWHLFLIFISSIQLTVKLFVKQNHTNDQIYTADICYQSYKASAIRITILDSNYRQLFSQCPLYSRNFRSQRLYGIGYWCWRLPLWKMQKYNNRSPFSDSFLVNFDTVLDCS